MVVYGTTYAFNLRPGDVVENPVTSNEVRVSRVDPLKGSSLQVFFDRDLTRGLESPTRTFTFFTCDEGDILATVRRYHAF